MLITVNGEPREVEENLTLLGLMEEVGVKPEITAVQRNEEIIDQKAVPSTFLAEGDAVELIRIVGGG